VVGKAGLGRELRQGCRNGLLGEAPNPCGADLKGRLLGALHLVPSRGARDHRRPSTPVSKHGQAAKFVGDDDVADEESFVRDPEGESGSRA
jgi:hypothetical protein